MKFQRIKDLRINNDKLQKDVAKFLGITQQYYSEYECGKRTFTVQHLISLSKYYNVSLDYMVGLVDEHKNKDYDNKKQIN